MIYDGLDNNYEKKRPMALPRAQNAPCCSMGFASGHVHGAANDKMRKSMEIAEPMWTLVRKRICGRGMLALWGWREWTRNTYSWKLMYKFRNMFLRFLMENIQHYMFMKKSIHTTISSFVSWVRMLNLHVRYLSFLYFTWKHMETISKMIFRMGAPWITYQHQLRKVCSRILMKHKPIPPMQTYKDKFRNWFQIDFQWKI